LKKDFAQLFFSVEIDSGLANSIENFAICRRSAGSDYRIIKEIAASELQNHAFSFYDKYLDSGVTYTYLIQARNARGDVIAISNEQSI
jgi:hypothetical protein